MADEQVEAVKEATPPETPPEKPKAEPEPDYKALVTEREKERDAVLAKLTKQENDLRSLRGSRERDADIRDKLTTFAEFLGHQNEYIRQQDKKLDILAKALGIDDPALGELQEQRQGIEKAVTASKEREATSQRTAEFVEWVQGPEGPLVRLHETNTGEDGKPILDLGGPELAAANQRWIAGASKLNEREVQAALFDAMNIINRAKREKEKAAAQVAKAAAKPTKPPPEEEPELDTGPGVGGLGRTATADTIDKVWMEWEREHPNQANPYDKQYRQILGR